MAKARMLHKSISLSTQVNKLPIEARLLFTWLIAHADDEGRLKGNPEYVKGSVVPLTNWSQNKIKTLLEKIKEQGLINYWQTNNEYFIEFIKWNNFQQIRKDRFSESQLPSFENESGNQKTTNVPPGVTQTDTQSNVIEFKKNKIELKPFAIEPLPPIKKLPELDTSFLINDTSISSESSPEERSSWHPDSFTPNSDEEAAAKEAWEKLEPNNPWSFRSTYLKAHTQGVPAHKIRQFVSEIKQDATIQKPGAVFRTKVKEYLMGEGLEEVLGNQENGFE